MAKIKRIKSKEIPDDENFAFLNTGEILRINLFKPGSATKVLQSKGQRWSVATIDGGVLPVAAMTLSGTLILVLQFTDALRFYMVTRIMKTVVFLLH